MLCYVMLYYVILCVVTFHEIHKRVVLQLCTTRDDLINAAFVDTFLGHPYITTLGEGDVGWRRRGGARRRRARRGGGGCGATTL